MTDHEEFLVLGALAEKQQQELVEKDQTIEAQKVQIETMIQALLHAWKKLFGPSAEVSKHLDGQLSLFETAQNWQRSWQKTRRRLQFRHIPVRQGSLGVHAEMLSGIVQQVAKNSKCGTDESAYDNCHFQKTAVPAMPLVHSTYTPSLIAQVMYQKFVMGMSFARQEKDWYRMGLVLPRADMAN